MCSVSLEVIIKGCILLNMQKYEATPLKRLNFKCRIAKVKRRLIYADVVRETRKLLMLFKLGAIKAYREHDLFP